MSPRNAHGRTLDRLGEAIVGGRYAPGDAVPPEPLLCEELGVSRTVVREAVKSLVAKGLVSTGPKVGTRVLDASRWNWFDAEVVGWHSRSGLTRDFLRELQELRGIIEPAAARLAAERATAQDLAEIEAAYAGMKAAVEQGGDYVGHDLAFHQGLLRASHNRMLARMGLALAALLRTSFEISNTRPEAPALSLPRHRALLDAVVARSSVRAERASLRLIASAQADIDAALASRRRLPSLCAPAVQLKPRRSP